MAKIEIDDEYLKNLMKEVVNEKFGAAAFNAPIQPLETTSNSLDNLRYRLGVAIDQLQEENRILSGRCDDLDDELEETIRGELLNLSSIKKHLETAIRNKDDYHSADFNYALTVASKDVKNLEKFVRERWGK